MGNVCKSVEGMFDIKRAPVGRRYRCHLLIVIFLLFLRYFLILADFLSFNLLGASTLPQCIVDVTGCIFGHRLFVEEDDLVRAWRQLALGDTRQSAIIVS